MITQCPTDDLTRREREVMTLVARGLSNDAICRSLWIAPKTLERHVRHIYDKFGLERDQVHHRRVRAVVMWMHAPIT